MHLKAHQSLLMISLSSETLRRNDSTITPESTYASLRWLKMMARAMKKMCTAARIKVV